MTVLKVCNKCGEKFEVEPSVKECSKCQGVLKRIFNKDSHIDVGEVREDKMITIDRLMLDGNSPGNHARSVI